MKNKAKIFLLLVLTILGLTETIDAGTKLNKDQAVRKDSLYLGQKPPVFLPEVFNLSTTDGLRPVERITIAKNGKEIYYGELDTWPAKIAKVKYYECLGDKWQGPFLLFEGFIAPALSENDSVMFLQTLENNIPTTFYSERIDSNWSKPKKYIPGTFETHYLQKTKLNNIYYSSSKNGNNDIYLMKISGKDTIHQNLGLPVNTSQTENDFFISSDESYIIFIRFSDNSTSDLLISYRKKDGGWTNPKYLPKHINTPSPNWECCPYVSPDSKYLFFTRGSWPMNTYSTYWVDIKNTIDSLKTTNFAPYLNSKIPNQDFTAGKELNFIIPENVIVDDDGINTITVSAKLNEDKDLPLWLKFNPETRTFNGIPERKDKLNIKIEAKDAYGNVVTTFFEMNINYESDSGKK